ncbi:putative signal transducing protein [Rhizosphaericola mali]|uniref:DUF2007 domain-containing protein n=1 Tax=Rhizosphaericola mali TaxID=2545455 RepID=A0A5P2G3Y2_9BACT|nr:DUF2007 domain-containing protein [Rhizosphaericola mali]QES90205.1 DUF2007 domain-containing protein [Rhizosphaericola mali]
MAIEYTLLRTYNNYVTANISLGMLKENGIACYLQDENVSTILPYLSLANGGIKLMVDIQSASEAEILLSDVESQKDDEDFQMGYFSN